MLSWFYAGSISKLRLLLSIRSYFFKQFRYAISSSKYSCNECTVHILFFLLETNFLTLLESTCRLGHQTRQSIISTSNPTFPPSLSDIRMSEEALTLSEAELDERSTYIVPHRCSSPSDDDKPFDERSLPRNLKFRSTDSKVRLKIVCEGTLWYWNPIGTCLTSFGDQNIKPNPSYGGWKES